MRSFGNCRTDRQFRLFIPRLKHSQALPTNLFGAIATGAGKVVVYGVDLSALSGKTLVAALAAYKRIVEEHRKVVYLSPLRALASEKYAEFGNLLGRFGVKCVISTGDFDSAGEALKNYEYEEWAELEVAKGRSLKGLFPVAGDQAKADYEAWKKAGVKK